MTAKLSYMGAVFPIEIPRVTLVFGATIKPYSPEKKHFGLDVSPFPAAFGEPVSSPWTSKVTGFNFDSGAGNYVIADTSFPFELYARNLKDETVPIWANRRIELHFYHFNKLPKVSQGQILRAGVPFGEIGSTGHSTGAHLHLGAYVFEGNTRIAIDPMDLLVATIAGLRHSLVYSSAGVVDEMHKPINT